MPRGAADEPAAGRFIAEVCERAATGGPDPMIVGIDGRSGSGKSTLAGELAAALRGRSLDSVTVQLDQLCPGWHGLGRAIDLVLRWVIEPVRWTGGADGAAKTPAPRYRRWDWHESRYAEWVDVRLNAAAAGRPVLIVEGCGIGAARTRELLDLLVWIDVPEPTRRTRAMDREREFLASAAGQPTAGTPTRNPLWWWRIWAAEEAGLLENERIPAHADFVVHAD